MSLGMVSVIIGIACVIVLSVAHYQDYKDHKKD